MVPDVYKACERFEQQGVNFIKKPDGGKQFVLKIICFRNVWLNRDLDKNILMINTVMEYSNTPLYRPTPYTIIVGGIDDLAV